eukprot:9157800-Pyramimonas_sp.AAC.1
MLPNSGSHIPQAVPVASYCLEALAPPTTLLRSMLRTSDRMLRYARMSHCSLSFATTRHSLLLLATIWSCCRGV